LVVASVCRARHRRGLVLLAWPVGGAVSLTLVLIVFFLIEGIASIMYALEHRQQLSGRWGWMLASGIVDLILAAMIFAGLPGTAAWALGLLVGINMLFGGSALVAMALHARARRRDTFTRFLGDGRICLTNNAAERALRGIALGRKAWLFAGSDRGGERAAAMYILIGTAKLNNLDPQAWLADVLRRINDHPASRLDELLPWNWKGRSARLVA
jgi:hypothetical protein